MIKLYCLPYSPSWYGFWSSLLESIISFSTFFKLKTSSKPSVQSSFLIDINPKLKFAIRNLNPSHAAKAFNLLRPVNGAILGYNNLRIR